MRKTTTSLDDPNVNLYFGKFKKTPEMNMNCFIICNIILIILSAAVMYVKNKQGGQITQKEVKVSQKFKKYLTRMNEVIDGNSKKIANTPVNIMISKFRIICINLQMKLET